MSDLDDFTLGALVLLTEGAFVLLVEGALVLLVDDAFVDLSDLDLVELPFEAWDKNVSKEPFVLWEDVACLTGKKSGSFSAPLSGGFRNLVSRCCCGEKIVVL